MGFSRQESWSGLPFLSPGDLPDPGIKPTSPAVAGGFFTTMPLGDPISGSGTLKRNKRDINSFLQVLLKLPQQQSWHPGPWQSHVSAEWKGQRVPCGEQSADLLPAGVGNCGVPSVPCQPACDSQRLLWASKCGMPMWEIKAPAPDLQLESVSRRDCGIKTHGVYSECRGYVDSVLERSLTTENLKGKWTCPFPLLNLMKLNLWVEKKKIV